mmetsp:Transcript_10887/g.15857  ORF Transcript_10887/g.15857 Transcript_10887/m.15857 type:complete len:131 (-) Transcript_10887:636-1028(-)
MEILLRIIHSSSRDIKVITNLTNSSSSITVIIIIISNNNNMDTMVINSRAEDKEATNNKVISSKEDTKDATDSNTTMVSKGMELQVDGITPLIMETMKTMIIRAVDRVQEASIGGSDEYKFLLLRRLSFP